LPRESYTHRRDEPRNTTEHQALTHKRSYNKSEWRYSEDPVPNPTNYERKEAIDPTETLARTITREALGLGYQLKTRIPEREHAKRELLRKSQKDGNHTNTHEEQPEAHFQFSRSSGSLPPP
jgi:hypothetical protein